MYYFGMLTSAVILYYYCIVRCLFAVYTAPESRIKQQRTYTIYRIQSGHAGTPVFACWSNEKTQRTTLYIGVCIIVNINTQYNNMTYDSHRYLGFYFCDVFIIIIVCWACNAHAISRNPSPTLTQCVGYGRRWRRRRRRLAHYVTMYIIIIISKPFARPTIFFFRNIFTGKIILAYYYYLFFRFWRANATRFVCLSAV